MPQDNLEIKDRPRSDYYLFILVLTTVSIIAAKYVYQITTGPDWDTYSFCINALEFAGRGTGHYEYDRGLFFPFLLSILFRLGFVTEKAAMFLDSVFLFLGSVALYKLVDLKCPRSVAFFSGLIFVTATIMTRWCAVGYADITSVSLSIMAIYFFIRGVEGERRFLLLSWPLAMCAFLSRTTAALIIFPMLFYAVQQPSLHKLIKPNIKGILLGMLVYAPVAWFYHVNKGDPLFYVKLVLSGLSASGDSIGMDLAMYNEGPYYYVEQLGRYIVNGTVYPILAAMVLIGIVVLMVKYLSISLKRPNTFMLLAFFLLLYYFSFERFSFKFLEMMLFLSMSYLYYYSRPNIEDNKALFCLMMVFWGLSYFVFHSSFFQKVPRYYITMMPAIAFIIPLSLYELSKVIDSLINRKGLTFKVLSIFLAISFLFTSVNAIYEPLPGESSEQFYADTLDMVEWIRENVEDFDDALVYSDYWVSFGWHFKKVILSMPIFFDDAYFDNELMKYGVDYYITYRMQDFPSCEELYRNDHIRLLKVVEVEDKPRGLYIGRGWENYFEYVMGFKCYLLHGETHIDQASDFVDDYTIEELSEYDFLALFSFKWHDSENVESLLEQYVEQGGTVFLDCSGNLEDPIYSLNYVQLFDMMVHRDPISKYPQLDFSGTPRYYEFSPFEYGGSPWYGATYSPIWSTDGIETVALANDDIMVAIERMGEGKLVWMGYNIVYHSFLNENLSEMEFLQYLLDYTVDS